jgi:hypothetical protein
MTLRPLRQRFAQSSSPNRRLRALLHHVTQRAREDQFSFPRHARRFDKQNITANWRPRQTNRDAVRLNALGYFGMF